MKADGPGPVRDTATLTALLERRLAERRARAAAELAHDHEGRYEPFPLTDVQQAYAVGRGNTFELGNVSCHVYFEVDATDLYLPRLESAWQQLVQRHDMLRAVVIDDGRQRILPAVEPYRVAVHDLRGTPSRVVDTHLAAMRARMSHQVLPADRWPLFELAATVLDEGRTRLHLGFDLLVLDAGSSQLLYEELVTLYEQPDTELAPLSISFRDYVLAERRSLEGGALARARDYWTARLESLPPTPELPRAVNPATITHPRFVRHTRELDAASWGRAQEAAAARGITPSALLLTLFADVLALWSKQPRFCLNLTLFNRRPLHPDVDRLVGDFTSLSLLEVDRHTPASFLGRAQALQQQLWTDLQHRAFSGVRVLRELARGPAGFRGAAMPVVFTSTLGLGRGGDSTPWSPLRGLGELVYSTAQTPQVWLDHQVFEEAGKLVYNWDAVRGLFPSGLLEDMLDVYHAHLDDAASHPERWEKELTPTIPAHQQRVRVWVDDTAGTVPDRLLHEPFEHQVRRAPQRPAVIAADRTLSYGELDAAATRLARRLRDRGARPNALVGVSLQKGWRQVVAVLGVLKAGAAYLPIAPDQPFQRRAHLLTHGEVEVVVTQEVPGVAWPDGVTTVLLDDDIPSPPSPEEGEGAAAPPNPDDLAYVIYTSGSTGLPKGVMIEHRAALNTVLAVNEQFGVGPSDRIFGISALNFDLSVYDIFGPLAVGGAVVLPAPSDARSPAAWEQTIERARVTIWNSVPALFEMLVEHGRGHNAAALALLRLAMLSGDWIPVTLPERAWGLNPDLQLVSLGGATEASIWSIFHEIEEVDSTWVSIPYGEALENQHCTVRDHRLNVRPDWAVGDLYIGGVGVARGYWGVPERTAERFIVHPDTGERLYRTGDLGRYLPDGTIEFLGRDDFQVKIGGHRIELGEIEAALSRHDAVEACVVAAPGERGHRRLVAYVVPTDSRTVSADELGAFLASTLPAYMVPAQIHIVDNLPLTANGKVDRTALPVPDAGSTTRQRRPATTTTSAVEQRLLGLFADVLGVDGITPDDDFFDLGGDSILAIQLVSRANRAGLSITAEQLFEHGTVAGLAPLAGAAAPQTAAEPAAAEPASATGAVPFTAEQRAYLDGGLAEPQNSYEVHVLEAAGSVDPALLEPAFAALLRHHDMLRSRFDLREPGPPSQEITALAEDVQFEVFDLADEPEERLDEAIQEASAVVQATLDIARGPVVSMGHLRCGDRPDVVVMVAYHLVVDAFSWRVLFEDLQLGYEQLEAGRPIELPARTVSFKDWSERLGELAHSDRIRADIPFWTAASGKGAALPRDRSVGDNTEDSASWLYSALSAGETRRLLQDVPRSTGARIEEVLLSALVRALGRWTGSDSLSVGLQRHGRDALGDELDISRTVGRFSYTYPVLLAGALQTDPAASVAAVKEQLRDVPNRGLSYGLLRYLAEDAEVARRWSKDALPEVGFNYVGQFDQSLGVTTLFQGLRWGPLSYIPKGRRRYLLEVHGAVRGGQMEFGWRYSENLHTRATIEALAEECLGDLRALAGG